METREKILRIIQERRQITAGKIAEYLNISRQALYKHLPSLLVQGEIVKLGRPPKVFYTLKEKEKEVIKYKIDSRIKEIINKNYLIISSEGKKVEGFNGFVYWCRKQNLPVEKTAREYIAVLKKYSAYQENGLINATEKMRRTFKDLYLDDTYYLDFYSIERFGKTKLGQMLLYAKQSQNKKLVKELIENIKLIVESIIKKFEIDAVGFIPPTVKREVQFMSEFKKKLNLKVKGIIITKIKTEIIIPQKTLSKINDRVENARGTFMLEETGRYKNILLIDDAVGSGATLNELAKKIKDRQLAKKVIGLAITGSLKGFDVISEV